MANSLQKLNDTELVNSTVKQSSKLFFMRGLRLWLIPRWDHEEAVPDVVAFKDFEPDLDQENGIDTPMFIKMMNNRIQEEPIPGETPFEIRGAVYVKDR
jgi:hypothetical protein